MRNGIKYSFYTVLGLSGLALVQGAIMGPRPVAREMTASERYPALAQHFTGNEAWDDCIVEMANVIRATGRGGELDPSAVCRIARDLQRSLPPARR